MEPGIHQTWKLAQYIIGIRTEIRQKRNAVHCSRGIYWCLYLIVKFCFFGALFCLLIKKLILEYDTTWQSMSKFLQAVWSVSSFPDIDKEETFLSWKLHIDMVWIFYTFSLDLKIWTSIFWKFSYFCRVQMIYVHPLTLNYPLQYAKRLSNIIAR